MHVAASLLFLHGQHVQQQHEEHLLRQLQLQSQQQNQQQAKLR